jgi:hypothetical protein
MIVEKQMECRLAGETEVLGENLHQHHFCPSQNPTWPDPGLNPGCRGGKPATNRLSYGAALYNPMVYNHTTFGDHKMSSASVIPKSYNCVWSIFRNINFGFQQCEVDTKFRKHKEVCWGLYYI